MRILAALAIIGFVAAPALADRELSTDITVSAAPLDSVGGLRQATNYSNMDIAGLGWSIQATGNFVGFDDYAGVEPGNFLESFRFIGGVGGQNEVLWFTFFTTGGGPMDNFGVSLPYAGAYIWTITITTPTDHPQLTDGFVQMWADNGIVGSQYGLPFPATGIWFGSIDAPTIGTTTTAGGFNTGFGNHADHKFEINFVPEPTTLALLGMGALALVRRR